jgi:hypothetical protein
MPSFLGEVALAVHGYEGITNNHVRTEPMALYLQTNPLAFI